MSTFTKIAEYETWRGWMVSAGHATFVDPGGEMFERDIIHHPGAVAVVAVDDDGMVTLVRQFRAPVGRPMLEVPAGTCDVDGEDPTDTARRELAEEVGLEARHLVELICSFNSPGFCDQQTVIYLASGLSECQTERSGTEELFMEVERVRLDHLDALVADRTLTDQTTVLALHLARVFLASTAGAGPVGGSGAGSGAGVAGVAAGVGGAAEGSAAPGSSQGT